MMRALMSAFLLVFSVGALVAQRPQPQPLAGRAWTPPLLSAVEVIAMQQPEPERHDKHKDDPKSYCLAGQPLDEHGWECACKAAPCDENGDRDPTAPEDPTCEHYCTGVRCLCHVDEGCHGHQM